MELGAAWARNAASLAVVVPPISYHEVTKTLGLKQAWDITDKPGLVDFRELIVRTITTLEKRTDHPWDDKRTHWSVALKKLIPKVQLATKIDAATHHETLHKLKEKEGEIDRLEAALGVAQENYAELEKVKDKQDLKALRKRSANSEALQQEFDEQIQAVKETMPQTSNVVLKHIIMDHFSLAGTIDWFNQKAEFEQAIQYGLLSTGDNSVRWERAKLKPLGEALQAVKTFLAGEEGETGHCKSPTCPWSLTIWSSGSTTSAFDVRWGGKRRRREDRGPYEAAWWSSALDTQGAPFEASLSRGG